MRPQIYLFGDLAIYGVTVPTSLAALFGGIPGFVTKDQAYYFYLLLFALSARFRCANIARRACLRTRLDCHQPRYPTT